MAVASGLVTAPASATSETAPRLPWYRQVTPLQWKTLFAAQAGWALDAMDVMLYAFALTTLRNQFGFSDAQGGLVVSATLVTAALGGILSGILADRYGRKRVLSLTLLVYSLASAGTATVGWGPLGGAALGVSPWVQLIFWRGVLGFGMGGEWACGTALVAETWPAQLRGRAMALIQAGWAVGYIAAAVLASVLLPWVGWRVLFLVGSLPALLIVWVRKHVPETLHVVPQSKRASPLELFGRSYRAFTWRGTALVACALVGYWGLFTWLPGFLGGSVAKGGAGLTLVKSAWWMVVVQIGAFFGYVSFGFFADRMGRKPALLVFLLTTALLTPLYGKLAAFPVVLIVLGPVLGFFGCGHFSAFGALIAELYPRRIRATALGTIYNSGRILSAAAPWFIGALADRFGVGPALGGTSLFLLAGVCLLRGLPETRGAAID